MARRRSYTPEQIITKLREAEIHLGQGKTVKEASKLLEISEQTYYRWRREYGGMDVTQAKKLKEMEKENARLKKLVADLSLDNAILKEVLGKK
ncbi:MAG: transposase [Gammaproteobacteria bacterium]|nr:transposase [Gammaproteobacteria bacterium]NIW10559.1 transposase [Gammaproteobacteria bacterium]